MFNLRRHPVLLTLIVMASLLSGIAAEAQSRRYTKPATRAFLQGEQEADQILAGSEIVVCNAIGVYMDRQQERLSHIPGTLVERMGDDTLLVHFDTDVLFAAASASLDRSGRSTLDQVAEVINDYRKTAVVIQGHTDSAGNEELNQSLSEQRARAVESYLASRGVGSDRMTSLGFGASAPLASNGTSSGRSRNRRVDILLKAKSGPSRPG